MPGCPSSALSRRGEKITATQPAIHPLGRTPFKMSDILSRRALSAGASPSSVLDFHHGLLDDALRRTSRNLRIRALADASTSAPDRALSARTAPASRRSSASSRARSRDSGDRPSAHIASAFSPLARRLHRRDPSAPSLFPDLSVARTSRLASRTRGRSRASIGPRGARARRCWRRWGAHRRRS